MSEVDAEIAAQLALVLQAKRKLNDLITQACPGPHVFLTHRDNRPAWCPACGYAWTGERIKEMP